MEDFYATLTLVWIAVKLLGILVVCWLLVMAVGFIADRIYRVVRQGRSDRR